ncbi:MAG TPA: hypothetical protein H9775_14535 [Candidatus Blautia merdipullorum]|nr:hypothetical protein [Candidatus Blautia merdipullorum]
MEYLKIVLRSDLCAGNGESVGNAVDTDVCMDEAGLPYIPARRLKGCLKQSARDMEKMEYPEASEKTRRIFGDAYGNEGCLFLQDAVMRGAETIREFLTKKIPADDRNIEKCEGAIPDIVKRMAHPANVGRMFSRVRGQTKLEDGVKVDNSLRFTRVISHYDPFDLKNSKEMEFYAPLYLNTEDSTLRDFLIDCCKATRHIGTSRNRGLGNVKIMVWNDDSTADDSSKEEIPEEYEIPEKFEKTLKEMNSEDKVKISYHISLDAPVTLPGCGELNTSIPARSVIGCLAGNYLRTGNADDKFFDSLFQNGDVCWSALTPVIDGGISDPAPMMLVKLKNDNGRLINSLAQKDTDWKGLKPKTMDSAFASFFTPEDKTKVGFAVAEPAIHTVYHHAVHGTFQDKLSSPDSSESEEKMLYMQESIDAGMIYGGTVICTKEMIKKVLTILSRADLRFGRSRSTQYASCSLKEIVNVEPCGEERISTAKGEAVYVILKSDLAIQQEGRYITDADKIRSVLADKLGLKDKVPDGRTDYCRYHTIGGYQSTWKLQKPHVPVVRAGSVYCFEASGESVPSIIRTGGFAQEGFGVCYVMTEEKMQEAVSVREGNIDYIEPKEDCRYTREIYTKLLVSAGLEAMRRYALDYSVQDEKIPVGRLRLMLSQAEDYQDFLRMIGTIKESDISSENENGRKKVSENLVRGIYSHTGKNTLSLKKILGEDDALWKEISSFPEAQDVLLKSWKVPLEIILHKQHYKKER